MEKVVSTLTACCKYTEVNVYIYDRARFEWKPLINQTNVSIIKFDSSYNLFISLVGNVDLQEHFAYKRASGKFRCLGNHSTSYGIEFKTSADADSFDERIQALIDEIEEKKKSRICTKKEQDPAAQNKAGLISQQPPQSVVGELQSCGWNFSLRGRQERSAKVQIGATARTATSEQRSIIEPKTTDISFNEIEFGGWIGGGVQGNIYRATWRGRIIAVKKVQSLDRFLILNLLHESRVLKRLSHPNIIKSEGMVINPETEEAMLVSEYMEDGSLENLLGHRLPCRQVIQLALDIAEGLNYLHARYPKIIHRDLKPSNILLYQNQTRAKICDFGNAKLLKADTLAQTFEGTLGYIAPEMFHDFIGNEGYTEKIDIYSFGMLLLGLATSDHIVPTTKDPTQLRENIQSRLKNSCMREDELFTMLVHECCQINPDKRPSMRHCVEVLKTLCPKYELQ